MYFIFLIDTPPPYIYTLSLHDALPISEAERLGPEADRLRAEIRQLRSENLKLRAALAAKRGKVSRHATAGRSEEHTSELQSRVDLVCRLLLEKKKKKKKYKNRSTQRSE